MTTLIPCESLLLLAKLSEISRHSRNSLSSQQYLMILIGIGILVAIWGVVVLLGKLRLSPTDTREDKQARPLLDQIASELELTPAELNLLRRMARQNQIQPPEVLLVDPGLWPPALATLPQDGDSGRELMSKLFGNEACERGLEVRG